MAWRVADELHVLNLAVGPPAAAGAASATALLRGGDATAGRARACALVTLEVRARQHGGAGLLPAARASAQDGVRPGYYPDTGEDAVDHDRAGAGGLPAARTRVRR